MTDPDCDNGTTMTLMILHGDSTDHDTVTREANETTQVRINGDMRNAVHLKNGNDRETKQQQQQQPPQQLMTDEHHHPRITSFFRILRFQ